MKLIPLTQGKFTMVDDEDFERVNKYKWCALKVQSGGCYAMRSIRAGNKVTIQLLHRLILNAPPDMEVDHKNRNGLDNQKANLRLATHQQNMCNKASRGEIDFVGVCRTSHCQNFRAQIRINGKKTYLGSFKTPQEAALAYDKKAYEVHGEFAALNFPEYFL